uniref:Uncharacterized protein n=1 Tax=Chromera velia CCMP2878 TaxID=1169474 RepID=A0A0G4I596_9ALVE|eukprot:Cvel_11035.t1-p1 / transcript=Cvel_11035.t1 / gene=Cvel_11035 / organism=Chromera_velia_CCMP2878 / gene_product=Zinc finger protein 283, putative / transcript_product=Zinc finger protein 283, putative / location=Cvel_scaffold680:52071-53003(-) / protein_length=311 / sequence_SO=supercontig / SO=protein_coding / is_pseudo=false
MAVSTVLSVNTDAPPSALLAPVLLPAVLTNTLPSALLALRANATVLTDPLPSALFAVRAPATVLTDALPPALFALRAPATVLTDALPCEIMQLRSVRPEAKEDFTFKSWAFCSLQARDAVLKGWGDKAMIDVAKLLTDLRGHGDMAGGLRGNLFEWFAHEKLISGETFRAEKMKNASEEDGIRSTRSPAETQDVQFGTTVKSVSRSKQDLEGLGEGDYGRPSIRTFPVLDAVSFPFGLQMAIGPHKQYKLKDFKDIAKLAGPSRSSRLNKVVFVVPADPQDTGAPEHSGFYCRWTGKGHAPECLLLPLPYS